ncbi:hypothetical protein SAMN04487934_106140 [Eubacterium ruminantium]|nr:hypothetical protein SAMN04487934_106140 [Eubacterium ruminantium]
MLKKKKKHLIIGISVLSLLLTGCGKTDDKEKENASTDNPSGAAVVSEEASTESGYDEAAVINSMTKSYKRGRVTDNNKYKNEFFGMELELDEGWKIYSDEEIDEMNQFQAGAATDENVAAVLQQSYLLDMAAARYDGEANISIIVESTGGAKITDEEYTKAGIDTAVSVMEQSGYTDAKAELGKISFCGRERTVINITAKAGDKEVFEKQLTMVNGSYVCVITFRAFSEPDIKKIVGSFKTIK